MFGERKAMKLIGKLILLGMLVLIVGCASGSLKIDADAFTDDEGGSGNGRVEKLEEKVERLEDKVERLEKRVEELE